MSEKNTGQLNRLKKTTEKRGWGDLTKGVGSIRKDTIQGKKNRELIFQRIRVERLSKENNKNKEDATRDYLTGLYNRRFFDAIAEEQVKQSRRSKSPLVMMVMDLDNFKTINSQLAHSGGDEALKFVAEFLVKHTRKSDIVCRWGGEEFAILLPNTELVKDGSGGVVALADKLREDFEKEFGEFLTSSGYKMNPMEVNAGTLTLAIGLLEPNEDRSRFFKKVDKALGDSKNEDKRNRVVVVNPKEASQ